MGFVLSEKAGVAVVGIKTGLIMPTDDIVEVTMDAVEDIVDDGDIVCVTEAVVARSQNRYITCDELAEDVKNKLGIRSDGTVAVISPIVSRNRFALGLQAIARAVNKGRVVVQLTVPRDEVGNQVIDEEFANNRLRFKKVLRSLQEGTRQHSSDECLDKGDHRSPEVSRTRLFSERYSKDYRHGDSRHNLARQGWPKSHR